MARLSQTPLMSFARRPKAGFGRLALGCIVLLLTGCDDEVFELQGVLRVEPSQLDFGRVPVGRSVEQRALIENVGSFSVDLFELQVDAPFENEGSDVSLSPGRSFELVVGFVPQATGEAQGSLRARTTDEEAPMLSIPLRGEGVEASVQVEPGLVDFGDVLRSDGSRLERATVTITNRGSNAFDLTGASLEDDGGGVFVLPTSPAPRRFDPGDSASAEVTFAPTNLEESRGLLRLTTTAPDGSSFAVVLRGRGVGPKMEVCAAAQGGVELCTARGESPRLDVGGIDVGQRRTGELRVSNEGSRPLRVEVEALGIGSPELSFSPALASLAPLMIPAGSSWALQVTYAPVDLLFDALNLVLTSDDPSRPTQAVLVEGRVPRAIAEAIPRRLTFQLADGTSEDFAPVRIVNCGTRPLRLTAALTLRPATGAFRLRNAPAANTEIAPGDCVLSAPGADFDIVFAPDRLGSFSAEVEIRTNDPRDPVLTVTAAGQRR